MTTDDLALVREYDRSNSEQAFATLVSRHVNLVYSVALRQVGDPHLAEEITQGVFIILAKKADSLSPKTILSGWLCRTARFISAHALRERRRRQLREREALMPSAVNDPEPDAWHQIAPLLEEALNTLGEKEHDAVVLRFFDGKELKQVGAAMGTTEDAARMRVNRGLDRLRKFFTRKGVAVSSGTLAGAIAANSVQAAPGGLAPAVVAAACSGTAFSSAAVLGATGAATMTTLQKALIACLFALTAATGVYQARQLSKLQGQNQRLEQQQSLAAGQILQLEQEREGLKRGLTALPGAQELQRLRKEHLELMSLRGRVRQLADELHQLKTGGTPADPAPAKAEPTDADSILFSAAGTHHVPPGQTLVVGGWGLNGMRGYLILTPTLRQEDGSSARPSLMIQSQVLGAPESFWNQIGWAEARSDTHRSSIAGVLTAAQVDTLLAALKGTAGSELSNTSETKGGDGERVGIGFSHSDERAEGMLMSLELYPHIGTDGQSVELEVRPAPVSPNTPVHPDLVRPQN